MLGHAALLSIVTTFIAVLHEIDEGPVDHPVASGRRVIAREVPIALVVRAGFL